MLSPGHLHTFVLDHGIGCLLKPEGLIFVDAFS